MSRLWRLLFGVKASSPTGASPPGPLPEGAADAIAVAPVPPAAPHVFASLAEVEIGNDGYEDGMLNRYIVAKFQRWLEQQQAGTSVWPPHLCALLWVIHVVQARLGRGLRVLDFGGGAPMVPTVLRQLGLDSLIEAYVIVETPAFVREVPSAWGRYCHYVESYPPQSCDLLILSSVLPYLSGAPLAALYRAIAAAPPRYIYFGRTAFLDDAYPASELFTIQRSRFGDHGLQIDSGMREVEDQVASYVRRHFKWAELAALIGPLGYRCLLSHADDSGLTQIPGVGLFTNNSLWERAE